MRRLSSSSTPSFVSTRSSSPCPVSPRPVHRPRPSPRASLALPPARPQPSLTRNPPPSRPLPSAVAFCSAVALPSFSPPPFFAEGADDFYETSFQCCVLSRVGLRIGMFCHVLCALVPPHLPSPTSATSPPPRTGPTPREAPVVLRPRSRGDVKVGARLNRVRFALGRKVPPL